MNAKCTVEEGQKVLDEGKKLHVKIDDILQSFKLLIQRNDKSEKEIIKLEKSNKNPTKVVLESIIVILALPLRSKLTNEILERWYTSSLWNSKAKAFIKDKTYENI